MARVTFLGACGTVTGSATLLSWGEEDLLVDYGLFQGPEELERLNWNPFPQQPNRLEAVAVTHGHLDHTGRLPRLVARGFRGPIYCSQPSRGLISLVLQDAGHLQEEAARWARKKGYSRHRDPQPLFTTKNVRKALRQLVPVPFDEVREALPGIRIRFRRAGHLLGAASVEVSAKGADGRRRTWFFSGDVGRYDAPILQDPQPSEAPPHALVLESTYGDRRHDRSDAKETFREVIQETFGRGGMVLIPAFALGRTQEVLYHLSALANEGILDPADVFLDSPMAIKASDLYRKAASEHDEEFAELVRQELGPLRPDRFHRCRTVDQSKALNERRKPAVVVAGSGMATGGRIVHHLLHRLEDPRSCVVFVGYQAAGTRGRALVEGADTVAIHGHRLEVRAQIHYLHMLSAHADRRELVRWCQALPGPPERIYLNHGEDPARKALAAALPAGWPNPQLPVVGDSEAW